MRIRRQYVQTLSRFAIAVLNSQQYGLLALQTGQVYEAAVRKEGIVFIVGLADFLTGENQQY